MSSTPKHLAMYEAFGWKPPKFAHVSLLVDKAGAKLSKRIGSVELAEWRDKEGVFPEVLNNFVALLGWSHNEKLDVMDMEELIRNVRSTLPRSHHMLQAKFMIRLV
jgi:glutamyl-tRNA synthetase